MAQGLDRFLNEEGKLKQWPSKQAARELAEAFLADKFEMGKDYSEQEVNAVLCSWHTFGDHSTLRRSLIESGFLCRTRDGSRYWRNPEKTCEPQ